MTYETLYSINLLYAKHLQLFMIIKASSVSFDGLFYMLILWLKEKSRYVTCYEHAVGVLNQFGVQLDYL